MDKKDVYYQEIPEGYEAVIDGNAIKFVKKESELEKALECFQKTAGGIFDEYWCWESLYEDISFILKENDVPFSESDIESVCEKRIAELKDGVISDIRNILFTDIAKTPMKDIRVDLGIGVDKTVSVVFKWNTKDGKYEIVDTCDGCYCLREFGDSSFLEDKSGNVIRFKKNFMVKTVNGNSYLAVCALDNNTKVTAYNSKLEVVGTFSNFNEFVVWIKANEANAKENENMESKTTDRKQSMRSILDNDSGIIGSLLGSVIENIPRF